MRRSEEVKTKALGRLFSARRIAEEMLSGTKPTRWVRQHAPGCIKFTTKTWGTMRRWREDDVLLRWAETVKRISDFSTVPEPIAQHIREIEDGLPWREA
jgi:hypothetical protein